MGPARGAGTPAPRGSGLTPSARLNGTEIAFDVAGEGPPVVLVHAGVGDRSLWDGQREALAERHLVVRYDLRGYGASPLPGGPFSYVDDLHALLDHLGIERAALVGNSFGGRIVLDYALEHPERTRALVLVAAALSGHEASPELAAFDEEEDALLEQGRLEEAVELNVRTWLDGRGREASPVAPEVRERLGAAQRRAFETLLAAFASSPTPGPVRWPEPPAATRLGEVSAPTLVVVGEHDLADFHAVADRLATEIPEARRAVVGNAAHLPALERPAELTRLVLDFLG